MAVTIDTGKALTNLSLTPLIDIVFLLLIFFLVATRFAEEERELDVLLPDASEARPLTSQPGELFINIDRQGQYYVTGKLLTLEELHPVLNAAYVNNPGRVSAIIRADERCAYGHVIVAKNACLKAKIRDIRETTRQSPLLNDESPLNDE
ncbi:MAG: ExbD/TolR family protein [Planctomycetota bacterium]|jgi:biopolymer transport protein ExbD